MFKKIEIWILYLIILLGIPITIGFGSVVRHEIQLTENKKLRDDFEDLRDEFEKVRALILITKDTKEISDHSMIALILNSDIGSTYQNSKK